MRILLVEDEEALAEALGFILRKNKYQVDLSFDGIEGEAMAESRIYDLIVLDRMLPGKEGVSICRNLRKQGIKTPVLFLTARDAVPDRIEGLDAGADDYLVKPFAKEELLARIRALLRRPEPVGQAGQVKLGGLCLNQDSGCVELENGEEVILSAQEMHLLELFLQNPGQVLSKTQIFDKIWGFNTDAEISNVELYVFYLRKKIMFKKVGLELKTVRGLGYTLKEI